jgi:hypothetical protein
VVAVDSELVPTLNRLIGTLLAGATKPEVQGALVCLARGDGEFDLRIPPKSMLRSGNTFFCAIRAGIHQSQARAVGVVLPVRSHQAQELVCAYLDAEALALVAVEDHSLGVASVGLRCPLHALPDGWQEAHEHLQSIARPLRLILAGRPLEEEEAV